MIIYKATNKKNGKSYIGQTSYELEFRIKSHFSEAKRDNLPFHNALLKNEKDFNWEVIEKCTTKEEMDEMEFHYIKKYNTLFPNGYNLTFGGEGNYGWIPTENQKLNISDGLKRWWKKKDINYRKQYGNKIRKRMVGNKPWNKGLTKENNKSLQSISKKSREYGLKCNYLPDRSGCKLTEEHKDKIRESKYGNKNGWHLSNITKKQLENKSKYTYEIENENGTKIIVKVLSV